MAGRTDLEVDRVARLKSSARNALKPKRLVPAGSVGIVPEIVVSFQSESAAAWRPPMRTCVFAPAYGPKPEPSA